MCVAHLVVHNHRTLTFLVCNSSFHFLSLALFHLFFLSFVYMYLQIFAFSYFKDHLHTVTAFIPNSLFLSIVLVILLKLFQQPYFLCHFFFFYSYVILSPHTTIFCHSTSEHYIIFFALFFSHRSLGVMLLICFHSTTLKSQRISSQSSGCFNTFSSPHLLVLL